MRPRIQQIQLDPRELQRRARLADRAVHVLTRLGVAAEREPYGLRIGQDVQSCFITVHDIGRYLVVVRDQFQKTYMLPRRTPVEVQRTIQTLGWTEEGWPIEEQAQMVIDLKDATCHPVS